MLFRKEVNLLTGEELRIEQVAIRTDAGEQTAIDAGQPIPSGWFEFDPETSPIIAQGAAPSVVTRRQGRLALLQAGKLSAVESAISAIADPVQQMAAQIEYENATWERGNPWIEQLGAQIGLTSADIDQLFVTAATL